MDEPVRKLYHVLIWVEMGEGYDPDNQYDLTKTDIVDVLQNSDRSDIEDFWEEADDSVEEDEEDDPAEGYIRNHSDVLV